MRQGQDSSPSKPTTDISLEKAFKTSHLHELVRAASDPELGEDLALALLKRMDLPTEAVEALANNISVSQGRKVRLNIIAHPKTPRHVAVALLRQLQLFELMQVARFPTTTPDVKRAADEALILKLASTSSGQRLRLARSASGRIAAELLLDKEPRVIEAALGNSWLVEASIIRTLARNDVPARFVEAVTRHPKWSLRREIRIALLRNEKTPECSNLPRRLLPNICVKFFRALRCPRVPRPTSRSYASTVAMTELRGRACRQAGRAFRGVFVME